MATSPNRGRDAATSACISRGSDTAALFGGAGGAAANQMQHARDIAANPVNAIDRVRDVSFAIDQLEKLNGDLTFALHGQLDLKHIGMAGHSFGADTTMRIAGQLAPVTGAKSFADQRVCCAIAMSPPVPALPRQWDAMYARVNIPLLDMTGTQDQSPIGETTPAERRVPFDHITHRPIFLLTLAGGDHMIFSGRRPMDAKPTDARHRQIILLTSNTFWDAYLRNDSAARQWFTGGGYAATLGHDAVFEMKL